MLLRPLATVLALALAGIAAGCGSSSSKPAAAPISITTTTPSTTTAPTQQQANGFRGGQLPAALVSCLKQHGVTFPTGGFGRRGGGGGAQGAGPNPSFQLPSAAERQKRQAAFTACQKFAPPGFRRGFGRGFGGGGGGRFGRYIACMRSHGVTIRPGGGQLDLTSPKFKAAAKQCRGLLPNAGAGTPPSGTQG